MIFFSDSVFSQKNFSHIDVAEGAAAFPLGFLHKNFSSPQYCPKYSILVFPLA